MTERYLHVTHIADLIAADITGRIDDVGRNELERWKGESPENMRLYEFYHSRDFFASKFEFIREYSAKEAFDQFTKRVEQVKIRRRRLIFYRYAAVVVTVFILSGIFYLNLWKSEQEIPVTVTRKIQPGAFKAILTQPDGQRIDISDTTYLAFVGDNLELDSLFDKNGESKDTTFGYRTISIPRGGEYDLTLSDGSRLRMNSESEIRIPVRFSRNQRDVYMKGEIYFDVTRNAEHPFVVHTHQGNICVLGTSFNVRNYLDEAFLETTLVKGKVAFQTEDKNTYLEPGEQLRLNKENGETIVEEVDVRLYCSWKDGRFVFEKQRLESIMNTVARWYNINVFYENQFVKDILFTGNIKRYDDLDQVIEMLRLINKIEIEINGNSVFVRSNP